MCFLSSVNFFFITANWFIHCLNVIWMLKSSYVAKKHRSMLAKETCLVRNRWETWKYEEIEVEKTCLQEFTNCAHLVSYSNLCDWIIKYGSLIDDCRQIRDLIMSRHLGGLNLADFNASPIKVKWGKIIITFSRWKGCKGKKNKQRAKVEVLH